jgi:uncharacterized protein (TIGR03067 family)
MTRHICGPILAAVFALLVLGCGTKPTASSGTPAPAPQTPGETKQSQTPGSNPAPKDDSELIQGTWKVESAVFDGKPEPAVAGKMTLTFNGKKLVMTEFPLGDAVFFKLDSTKTPKAIDAGHAEDKTNDIFLGLYELNGDQLKICFTPPGGERPTAFESKQGKQAMLLVLKRDKDAPPPKEEKLFEEKDYPSAIVGKWKFVSGETMFGNLSPDTEFTKDGKVLQYESDKKTWVDRGTYRLEKNELVITPPAKDGKTFPDRRYKLASISDDHLVSRSPSGKLKRQK